MANTSLRPQCELGTRATVVNRYASRPRLPVLKGVTLSCSPGTTTALVGPSGSGEVQHSRSRRNTHTRAHPSLVSRRHVTHHNRARSLRIRLRSSSTLVYLSLTYYRSLDHSSKRSGDLRTYSATYERTCARVCLFFFLRQVHAVPPPHAPVRAAARGRGHRRTRRGRVSHRRAHVCCSSADVAIS